MRWLVVFALFVSSAAFAQEAPVDPVATDKVDEDEAPADEAAADEAPAEKAPVEEPDAVPVEDPASSEPVPDPLDEPAPPPPPPVGGDMVNLGVDRELDDRMERCFELIAERKDERARACLEEVAASKRTTAGLVARGVRRAYKLQWDAREQTDDPMAQAKLWMGVTGGVFGLQHGLSLSILLATNTGNALPGEILILAGGALTIGGIVGYGLLGAWAAEEYGLTATDAHLLFAGGFWGGVLGAQLAGLLALNQLTDPNGNVVALTQLFGALIGGTGALFLQKGEMSDGHTSMMNTGGILGAFVAGMGIATLSAFVDVADPNALLVTLMLGQVAGLAGGAVVGGMVDYSWGEVLLIDTGAVIGFVGSGTILLAAAVSLLNNLPQEVGVPIITVGLTAGTIGGAVTAGYLIQDGRKNGDGKGAHVIRPVLAPTVLLDKNQQIAPAMAMGFTF